jgi:hypothetical protein
MFWRKYFVCVQNVLNTYKVKFLFDYRLSKIWRHFHDHFDDLAFKRVLFNKVDDSPE